MNERIQTLMEQAMELVDPYAVEGEFGPRQLNEVKFAELIVKECINTLEFHGFDDAVPYIKWMATNKLGVK